MKAYYATTAAQRVRHILDPVDGQRLLCSDKVRIFRREIAPGVYGLRVNPGIRQLRPCTRCEAKAAAQGYTQVPELPVRAEDEDVFITVATKSGVIHTARADDPARIPVCRDGRGARHRTVWHEVEATTPTCRRCAEHQKYRAYARTNRTAPNHSVSGPYSTEVDGLTAVVLIDMPQATGTIGYRVLICYGTPEHLGELATSHMRICQQLFQERHILEESGQVRVGPGLFGQVPEKVWEHVARTLETMGYRLGAPTAGAFIHGYLHNTNSAVFTHAVHETEPAQAEEPARSPEQDSMNTQPPAQAAPRAVSELNAALPQGVSVEHTPGHGYAYACTIAGCRVSTGAGFLDPARAARTARTHYQAHHAPDHTRQGFAPHHDRDTSVRTAFDHLLKAGHTPATVTESPTGPTYSGHGFVLDHPATATLTVTLVGEPTDGHGSPTWAWARTLKAAGYTIKGTDERTVTTNHRPELPRRRANHDRIAQAAQRMNNPRTRR